MTLTFPPVSDLQDVNAAISRHPKQACSGVASPTPRFPEAEFSGGADGLRSTRGPLLSLAHFISPFSSLFRCPVEVLTGEKPQKKDLNQERLEAEVNHVLYLKCVITSASESLYHLREIEIKGRLS